MCIIKECDGCVKYTSKVNRIKKIGKSDVYDIEVKDVHRLVANGFYTSNCSHPDVINFIKVKSDKTKIQNANISVQCTNKFYEACLNDKDWELHFEIPEVKKGQKVYIDVHSTDKDSKYDEKTKKWYYIARKHRPYEKISHMVKAKEILELIAKGMCEYAEPGIQNIDIARKYSNSDYVYDSEDEYNSKIISTNACSEQMLSRDGCCILSSINAGKFSENTEECEKELEKIGASINRFLDNVNEVEVRDGTYATPMQKIGIEKLRRTGAGYTNIAGWLFKKNLEYGSEEGNKAIEKFTERFNYYLYKSSIEIGKEKGSFGLFKREKFEKSPFVKRMMKLGLEFETMRNVTCSSIAPTGSLSLMFRDSVLSYGIEPAFGIYFWKRTRIAGHYEYYFCVPRIVRDVFEKHGYHIPMESDTIKDTWDGKLGRPIAEFIEKYKEKINIKFRSATDIKAMDKLDLMARVMKWVDSSISVTYMLPENSDWKMVYDFIIAAHEKEVKSIAAFPDKKMYGIVSFVPFQDLAKKLIQEEVTIHEQNFSKEELDELYGKVYLPPDEYKIQKTRAPVRPKELSCDIHHTKVTKKLDKVRTFDYIVLVGIMPPNDPYEIFVAENGVLDKKYKTGVITKKARGVYSLLVDGQVVLDDICKDATESEDVLTRMVSTSLRHGADIHFIVQQLEKSKGDLFAFSKAICRVLKKYVPDHTKVVGETCKQCGGTDLIRLEGCATCTKCGHSKCS